MTYLEYAQIVCPEHVCLSGFVSGCPETHGLPRVKCSEGDESCVRCYSTHIVPDDIAAKIRDEAWFLSPPTEYTIEQLLGY